MYLRIFCFIFLFFGIVGIVFSIILDPSYFFDNIFRLFESYYGSYDTTEVINILGSIKSIIYGLIFLSFSNGLFKKEKWAFYIVLIFFVSVIVPNIISLFFDFSFNSLYSFLSVVYTLVIGYLLYLLVGGRQIFIQQPKEKISQWFSKPSFVKVIIGIFFIISLSIFIIILES